VSGLLFFFFFFFFFFFLLLLLLLLLLFFEALIGSKVNVNRVLAFSQVAQYVIRKTLPVVPHKAVAEVSKIGNL